LSRAEQKYFCKKLLESFLVAATDDFFGGARSLSHSACAKIQRLAYQIIACARGKQGGAI
jgi:hypothetical protein